MATAHKVLSIAAKEIGYSRWTDPKNGTKYGRWYADKTSSSYFGTNGVPYCAMFVAWVLAQAGQKCSGMPTASCTSFMNGARKAGLVRSSMKSAKAGDAVIFDWDGDGSPDHVGFVEKNKGSYIQTIEGNTSSGASGSQSNGGGVYRRTRDWGVVLAVIAIPYDKASGGGSSKLTVDGLWGEDTTRAAQKQAGTPVDGIVSSQEKGWKSKFKGCTTGWEWVSKPKGSQLIEKIQTTLRNKYGQDVGKIDGIAGKKFWQAMERAAGYDADNKGFEYPSNTVRWFQRQLNAGTFF